MIVAHIPTKPTSFGHADNPLHSRHSSDWRSSVEPAFGHSVPQSRAQMEPPRPLEPRHERTPSLSTPARRLDSFSAPTSVRSPLTQHTQTLPGVRDILSPPGAENGYPGPENWRAAPPQHFYPDARYQVPVAPRSDQYTQQDRRVELPILETRHAAGLPASPYGPTHHESLPEARPRQLSTSSYSTSSPYAMQYEHAATRGTTGEYDRSSSTIFTPATDSSRRYVGIKDFPEGQFHVYDDGHRLPTHVDGEQVNPQWGLTKANKPRKRLALACMDCREKKIKCEPGATSCLQCEKAKRTCRRYGASKTASETSPRPDAERQNVVDNGSTTEWSSNAESPPARAGAATEPTPPRSSHADLDHMHKRRAQDDNSTHNAIKRQKSPSPPPMPGSMARVSHAPLPQPGIHSEDVDPYIVNPTRTMHLIEVYFRTVNNGVYSLFPQEPLMRWVAECRTKSLTDRMVVHAMMAMASMFTLDSTVCDWRSLGEHCAQLATAGLNAKFGIFSLQIVHVRLLLALYSFARNMRGVAWEHCGAAVRTISALRYNNDEGCNADKPEPEAKLEPNREGGSRSDTQSPHEPGEDKTYGLRYNQIVECRRRAFWCGFMMDRFNGFCEGMLCTIDKADVYLQLPCSQSAFDKGARSQAPFFDNSIIERSAAVLTSTAPVSHMAHLALITSIWGDVMNFVYRGVHRSSQGHAEAYEQFYADTYKNLKAWSARLPLHLEYTEANLIRSIHEGYAGDFVTIHVMYHYALIKLNRCMRWSLMQDKLPRNICEAHIHAHQLLGIISAFNKQKLEIAATPGPHAPFTMSTPFVGFAIISTIDIVSAGGPEANLKPAIEGMKEGLAFLRELVAYWGSIADQHRAGEKRFLQLTSVISRPYKAHGGCWLGRQWGLQNPLEREVDAKDDCIYGVDDPNLYYSALENLQIRDIQRVA